MTGWISPAEAACGAPRTVGGAQINIALHIPPSLDRAAGAAESAAAPELAIRKARWGGSYAELTSARSCSPERRCRPKVTDGTEGSAPVGNAVYLHHVMRVCGADGDLVFTF